MLRLFLINILACFISVSCLAEDVYEDEQMIAASSLVDDEDKSEEMIRIMAPILMTIEENKKLPKASSKMAEKIKSAIVDKYNQNTSYIIDKDTNSVELDGYYKKNNTIVKYRLIRNLSNTLTTDAMLKKENSVYDVANLSNKKIATNKLKINKINKNDYIGYANKADKQMFLFANIGAYLALQVESRGNNFSEEVKGFIYSLDFDKLKAAVADDGRDIEDIKIMINEKIQNPDNIDELFAK